MKPSGFARRLSRVFLQQFLPIILVCALGSPAMSEEYLIYRPNPLESAGDVPREDGVLVKKIVIMQGDTLSGISRQFSGKGSFFPQILLFNAIKNPNRIYAGRELLVPVTSHRPFRGDHPSSWSGSRSKKSSAAKSGRIPVRNKEKRLFSQAVAKFSRGGYREALASFDLFLNKYPNSSLAPDASLYRADCYLRLSGR